MSEKRLNEERSAIEAALCALKPLASSTDRDRVLFLAGRASAVTSVTSRPVQKTHWIWPCITAAALLLAICSSTLYYLQGPFSGERPTTFVKDGIEVPRNIFKTPRSEAPRSSLAQENRQEPGLSTRRQDAATSLLALSTLAADKGIEALPGSLWVPLGAERPLRRDPTIHDDGPDF